MSLHLKISAGSTNPNSPGWVTDAGYFSGGANYTKVNSETNVLGIQKPAPQIAYQSVRYGDHTQTVTGLDKTKKHIVRIHLASDTISRGIDLKINGILKLDDYNIFDEEGADVARVYEYKVFPNSSGEIIIELENVTGNGWINAYEIIEYDTFDFCFLQYPLDYKYKKNVGLFLPEDGPRQTRTKKESWRYIEIKASYFDTAVRKQVLEFWHKNYPDRDFYFYDRDSDQTFEAFISSDLSSPKSAFGKGEFAFTIEEVEDMPDDFTDPELTSGLTLSSPTSGDFTADWTAPTDDIGVTEIEIQIDPPVSI